jgi:hypothetical protein
MMKLTTVVFVAKILHVGPAEGSAANATGQDHSAIGANQRASVAMAILQDSSFVIFY